MSQPDKPSYCPKCGLPKRLMAPVCRDCDHTPSDDEIQDRFEEMNALAREIADHSCRRSIISLCRREMADGDVWFDLDTNESVLPVRAELKREIAYCAIRNLLRHHPTRPNLVLFAE